VPEDDAVAKHSSQDGRVDREFGPDSIEGGIRERVREVIQTIVNEELEAALGAGVSRRVEGRQGYRHGTRERTVTTSLGPTTIEMPRARLHGSDDGTREWRSATVPRYQRRTARVDEAILGL
jgi:transposase-like protein